MATQWNLTEFTILYQARHLLSRDLKGKLGLLMPVDIYVKDPYLAESNEELALSEVLVECEPDLMAGPTNARIAVVDYDGDTQQLEDPVHWDRRNRRFYFRRNGEKVPVTKEHRDLPQFHQVNVWATIQSVLQMYEATWVLGRSVPWAFEGIRLIVRPHAGYGKNAFYDRNSKSLQFKYFDAVDKRVYTCLSHDIVARETGHAILDGLRPYYFEDSSLETRAFHTFVADLTAIMSSLLNDRLQWEMAEATEGDLSRDTLISGLAAEFALYASGRPHLRSAQNQKTMEDVADSSDPYSWSEVLLGGLWDILSGVFARYRTRPLQSGRLPTDRQALYWAVNHLRRVALQPLDYLPPVDVQFCDYARAVLRADELVDPADENDFRGLMREVFGRRGIELSTEGTEAVRLQLNASDFDRLSRSRTDAYHVLHENRRQLCIPAGQDFSVVDLYRTDKMVPGGGRLPREIVVQYVWREKVPLEGARFGRFGGRTVSLLCGGALVFDERGNVLHCVRKPGCGVPGAGVGRSRAYCDDERAKGLERRKQLLDYVESRIRFGGPLPGDGGEPEGTSEGWE